MIEWDLSGWDAGECGRRTLRRCEPPRPVLVNMDAALPPGVLRTPHLGQRLYVASFGLHLVPWMPGRQIAWVLQSTDRWWAMISVDTGSSNKCSRLTIPMLVAPDNFVLDTPGNRAKYDIDRRPPWITNPESKKI